MRCALLLRREPLPDPALRPAEEPRLPESGCGQARADGLPLGVGGSVHWLHSVPVFSSAKIVKITERCGLRSESMHVRCDFLCCGREYPGLCACRLFFRLLTLLFSGCFYYLYGTVVPGPGKFGVSLPRCSRAPYSGIAPPPPARGGWLPGRWYPVPAGLPYPRSGLRNFSSVFISLYPEITSSVNPKTLL